MMQAISAKTWNVPCYLGDVLAKNGTRTKSLSHACQKANTKSYFQARMPKLLLHGMASPYSVHPMCEKE